MVTKIEAFIGIDAEKLRNAVAIAEEGRDGEIRYLGEGDASPESMRRLLASWRPNTSGCIAATKPVRQVMGCIG